MGERCGDEVGVRGGDSPGDLEVQFRSQFSVLVVGLIYALWVVCDLGGVNCGLIGFSDAIGWCLLLIHLFMSRYTQVPA